MFRICFCFISNALQLITKSLLQCFQYFITGYDKYTIYTLPAIDTCALCSLECIHPIVVMGA